MSADCVKHHNIYFSLHDFDDNILKCKELPILGTIFQDTDLKFASHARDKLIKANKFLYVMRTLRAEDYSQCEKAYPFKYYPITIGLFRLYGSSPAELDIFLCIFMGKLSICQNL